MLQQNTAEFKVNQENLETFWWFINERHRIFIAKSEDKIKPWSQDPYFQKYKFDNIFRKLDRTSAWYTNNIVKPHWDDDQELLLFNTFVFRAFNWIPTYEQLLKHHGKNGWLEVWDQYRVQQILRDYHAFFGNQLTSGAYMIRGYLGEKKWESIPRVLADVWALKKQMLTVIKETNSLEEAVNVILYNKLWGWGPFTAYQVALDLTYGPILENPVDINSWCIFGPGAKRGLEYIFPDIASKDHLAAAKFLTDSQKEWLESHVPELTLNDTEFCLCEVSKYIRLKNGGRGVAKYDGI